MVSRALPTDRLARAVYRRLKTKLDTEMNRHLLDVLDTRTVTADVTPAEKALVRRTVEQVAAKNLKDVWLRRFTPEQRQDVVNTIVEAQLGSGPLELLLHDPSVSEIMVNGPSEIFVERHGRLERTTLKFHDRDELMGVVERMLSSVGRWVSVAEPYIDARLANGYRLNVTVWPIALNGPCVTIRKFSRELLSIDRLIRVGTLTAQVAEFLQQCVRGGLNFVISGPAASGKTTMMNALAHAIPLEERLVVIEDTAELQLPDRHVTRLETRPPNIEGRGEVTMRHLLKNALHMRPDRILLGEVRGEEALDMLQAMTTGHDGSMTTVHATTAHDVIDRLTTMALMSGLGLSLEAVERQARSAIHLIVHLDRFGDGSRRVTRVTEVGKERAKAPFIDLFTIPSHDGEGWGSLQPTGSRPGFIELLQQRGVQIRGPLFASPAA